MLHSRVKRVGFRIRAFPMRVAVASPPLCGRPHEPGSASQGFAMADNIHWLRDTYGPALRAFYAELVREPVPQRFKDLLARLEAEASQAEGAPPDANTAAAPIAPPEQPVDASE
jgi:hypothetical protein